MAREAQEWADDYEVRRGERQCPRRARNRGLRAQGLRPERGDAHSRRRDDGSPRRPTAGEIELWAEHYEAWRPVRNEPGAAADAAKARRKLAREIKAIDGAWPALGGGDAWPPLQPEPARENQRDAAGGETHQVFAEELADMEEGRPLIRRTPPGGPKRGPAERGDGTHREPGTGPAAAPATGRSGPLNVVDGGSPLDEPRRARSRRRTETGNTLDELAGAGNILDELALRARPRSRTDDAEPSGAPPASPPAAVREPAAAPPAPAPASPAPAPPTPAQTQPAPASLAAVRRHGKLTLWRHEN